jgi:hypothetical protein
MTDTYRIRQKGATVAQSAGQHSLRAIMQHADVFRQEGALSIERRVNKRWVQFGVMSHG